MAPEWPISVERRDGVGDLQGGETPWPLVSAQQDANNE